MIYLLVARVICNVQLMGLKGKNRLEVWNWFVPQPTRGSMSLER